MNPQLRATLLRRFRALGLERVARVEAALTALVERRAAGDERELLLRELHTLKGEARMLQVPLVDRLSHGLEDRLAPHRDDLAALPESVLDRVLEGLDLLRPLLESAGQAAPPAAEAAAQAWLGEPRAAMPAPATTRAEATPAPGDAPVQPHTREIRPSTSPPAAMPRPDQTPRVGLPPPTPRPPASTVAPADGDEPGDETTLVRIASHDIETVRHLAGDLGLHLGGAAAALTQLGRQAERCADALGRSVREQRGAPSEGLVEARSLLDELRAVLPRLREALSDAGVELDRLVALGTRLSFVELREVLEALPPAARTLARTQGKRVRVTVEGGHLTIDRRVLDRLEDALVHLVRNAVAHGASAPAEREAEGKDVTTQVAIRCVARGGRLQVVVEDDGPGLDDDAIRRTLIRRALLPADAVAELPLDRLRAWLFQPNFSTRETVSSVSGRGVGLEAVRRAIESVDGAVRVESEPGSGTRFVLDLPMAITRIAVLLLRHDGTLFALPATGLGGVLRPTADAFAPGADGLVLRTDGGPLPVASLRGLLGGGEARVDPASRPWVLHLVGSTRSLALAVDSVLGQRDALRVEAGPLLARHPLVAGFARTEASTAALLLDVDRLCARAAEGVAQLAPAAANDRATSRRPTVLLVEDSDLTREMLAALLGRLGYRVVEAVNGRDALERLPAADPALVITDLDMPVMDGFRLIERIRGHHRFGRLPIVVLSTRDHEAAKTRAAQIGADAYVVKSDFNEGRLVAILSAVLEPRS